MFIAFKMKIFNRTSRLVGGRSDSQLSGKKLSSSLDDMSTSEDSTGDCTADITPFNSPDRTKANEHSNVLSELKENDVPKGYVMNQQQEHHSSVHNGLNVCEIEKPTTGTGEDGTQDSDDSPFTVSVSTPGTQVPWDECSDAGSSFISSDFQSMVFGDDATDDFSSLSEHLSTHSEQAYQITQLAEGENADISADRISLQGEDEESIDFPTIQEFEDLDEVERMEVFKRMRMAFVQSSRSNVESTNQIQVLKRQLKRFDVHVDIDTKPTGTSPSSLTFTESFKLDTSSNVLHSERESQNPVAPVLNPMDQIKMLEMELLNMSMLLEQTITSVERLERIPRRLFQKLWTRKWGKGTKKGVRYSDENILHLERMCKIHQFTILKQQQEIQALKNEINLETSHHQREVESLMTQLNQYGQEIHGLQQELSMSNNEVKKCKGITYDLQRKITLLYDEIEALEAQMKISGVDRQWMI